MLSQGPQKQTFRIVSLAWPILIGQLAVIANAVVDTMMVSRFSVTDLGALAVGASIYISVFVGLNGVLQSLSPIIGQLYGARKFSAIGGEVKQGVWLGLLLSFIGALLLIFPQPLLSVTQASPELTAKASLYLRTLALALPASLGFVIFGALNNAMGRPKMVMALQVSALLLKIPLNGLFIFGGLGLPALGGPGCAISTAITSWLILAAGWLILRFNPFYKPFQLFGSGFQVPRWTSQKELLKLGIPVGMNYFIEVTAFTFMALFIARLGETAVAGHQIVGNFATVLYMLPLSIASATGTLTSHAIGAHDMNGARRIGFAGIRLAALVSTSIGVVVWFARDFIVRAYTPDESIAVTALPLFLFIASYQFFDALQVTASYILRAHKVVLAPTVMYSLTLWGIGLFGGYVLGLDPFDLHPPGAIAGVGGFWFGTSISLVILASGMLWLLLRTQRKALQA
jgi:MATE family multidrug resistance protein